MVQVFMRLVTLLITCGSGANQLVLSTSLVRITNCKPSKSDSRLEELGQERPEVLFYSFIKLPEGKMSTRQGNVVFMDDLLEEAHAQASAVVRELRPEYDDAKVSLIAEAVGTAAVRFNIIKVSPEKGFTFRWEEALPFEAGSAPFIMYAHTRACSIAKRARFVDFDTHHTTKRGCYA